MSQESVMGDSFATTYLAARMATLQDDSNYVLTSIQTILDRQAWYGDYNAEREAVAVLPAFMMLVPLRASAQKMIGEITPSLKDGEDYNMQAMFQSAGVSLYRAVGTYSTQYSETSYPWDYRWAPVGLYQNFMFKRLLYSYHHRLTNGALNTYPALRFSQYQSIPIIDAALTTLEQIEHALEGRGQAIMVPDEQVWIYDPYTDPNASWTNPSFETMTGGMVSLIWACDINDVYPYCPKIETEGN
jgi:hypothetical protein